MRQAPQNSHWCIAQHSALWALASHSLRPKLMTACVQKAAFRHSNDFLSAIASYAGYVLPCFATGLPCSSLIFP